MHLARNKFGKSTTADEVLSGRSLAGMRVVVTGGASGIGVETVRAIAGAGADVIVGVRDIGSAERTLAGMKGSMAFRPLDLADFDSVRAFAAGLDGPIDRLIDNAGVMASPKGKTTKQGFELQMGTNHLGHFLLTTTLLSKLAKDARVVVVASSAHRRGSGHSMLATLDDDRRYEKRSYNPMGAYGDSKLANILFTRSLARRLPAGQSAFSLHPGVIPTPLSRHFGIGGAVFRVLGAPFMKTPQQGAATTVFAAAAPGIEQASGAYLSDCNEADTTADGQDMLVAEKLWALSESIVAA